MVIVETSFPRGGTVKPKTEKSEIDFGARQEKRKKDKSKRKHKDATKSELATDLKAFSAELLSHKTIQEGMLVMGVIKTAQPTFLKVSLPGRIVGNVPAVAVSDSYTKLMKRYVSGQQDGSTQFKPLTELFCVGQVVYVRVLEISRNDHSRLTINLSLKPVDVHEHFNHQSLRKGQIFCGAIEEVQEHGYVIETGVKNLRCFLPLDKSEEGLSIGKLVCLKIEKLTQTSTASTAVCKMLQGENRKVKDLNEPNLDYLLPTSVVNFTISKILKDGLQGTIMNQTFTSYVNEHQLTDVMHVSNDYEVNVTIPARILYVMPLSKLVYLSLRTKTDNVDEQFNRGEIVDNATVHHIGTGGIVLDLNGKGKGLISFKSIKMNLTGNYDRDEAFAKYKKGSRHRVRILEYDRIDCLYTCSDNSLVVNEKFYTIEDLKSGDIVTGVITQKDGNGGYFVQVGKVRGLIEKIFLAANTGQLDVNAKVHCRVIWKNPDRNIVYVTNRNEYMSKTAKLLTQRSGIKVNRIYTGTIVQAQEKCFVVRFFANIKGLLYKNHISRLVSNDLGAFYEGATMNFRIVSFDGEKIVVGLAEEMHKLGEICEARVTNTIQHGLEIAIEADDDEEQIKGLVPIRLLSDFQDLVAAHLKTYHLNDEVTVACTMRNIYSIRDVKDFQRNGIKYWKDIRAGDILKGVVKNVVEKELVEVMLPIGNYDKLVKIHLSMFLEHSIDDSNVVLVPDQVVSVKILSKEKITKTLTCSAKLCDVWDCQLKTTGQWFVEYLQEVKKIRKRFKAHGQPISMYKIGEKVTGKLKGFSKMNDEWTVELSEGVRGIIKSAIAKTDKNLKADNEMNFVVLWVDYSTEVVYLSHKTADIEHLSMETKLPGKYANQVGVKAKILMKSNDFILCSIKKGKNPIIFVPAQVHFNDFEKTIGATVKEGDFCRLALIHDVYPVAVFESTWKLWNQRNTTKRKASKSEDAEQQPAKKSKSVEANIANLANSEETDSDDSNDPDFKLSGKALKMHLIKKEKQEKASDSSGEELNDDSDTKEPPKKRILNDKQILKQKKEQTPQKPATANPLLPGTNDFWSTNLDTINTAKKEPESSDEEDEDDSAAPKKKKRQTASEKFKAAREEEARLRQIEENYANPHKVPDTADEFDRLVLTNPNSSMTWINYMVFHLQGAEIDKARAIARKALKAISFREEQEQINIWIALLNLELRYGTKESFTGILKEATLCNDPYKIYARSLQILADAKKTQELCDMIPTVTKKFKEKPDIWKSAATAYFELGLEEKAKQLLHKALAALPDRDHINTIVMFANLHHKHNDKETAHTLLDQIVTSYPKRVDVWSQYVDMLIKDNDHESARRTLERAVVQKIPMKKMRTLFKKYLDFEEKFGNEETVQNVKQMAANYVKNEIQS